MPNKTALYSFKEKLIYFSLSVRLLSIKTNYKILNKLFLIFEKFQESGSKLKGYVIFLILFCFALNACQNSNRDPVPDISNISVNLKWIRFEKELFSLDTMNLKNELFKLIQKYPEFCRLYFTQIVPMTNQIDSLSPEFTDGLRTFLNEPSTRALYQKTTAVFKNDEDLIKALKRSTQLMKYYFPNEKEPVFYSLISNFNYANFIFIDNNNTNGIGISLDYFLGSEMDYKKLDPKNPVFSDYLTRCFNKDHLLKKTWESYISDKLTEPQSGQFIDYIIHRGKKLYILQKLVPEIEDTVLFEYSPKQLDWCNKNRLEIWSYFLSGSMLYSTEFLKFNKFINPSPDSPGMPADAPGQTGSYIGYYLVQAYMSKHPKMTLSDLIGQQNAQLILKESRFKPLSDK